LGAEGIVSKRVDGTYRSGPCSVWIEVRNPARIAVQRERSEKVIDKVGRVACSGMSIAW